jgi:hypothetical protein
LDGLSDRDAQFHVEYVNEPVNIDEAVFQVVSFEETGRGQKHKVARQAKLQRKEAKKNSVEEYVRDCKSLNKTKAAHSQNSIQDLQDQLERVRQELDKYSQQCRGPSIDINRKEQKQQNSEFKRTEANSNKASVMCYCCKDFGHFARDYPQRKGLPQQELPSTARVPHLSAQ